MLTTLVILFHLAHAKEMTAKEMAELRDYQPIRACYESYLAKSKDAKTAGIVVMEIGISKSGHMTRFSVDPKKTTLPDPVFTKCIGDSLIPLVFNEKLGKERLDIATFEFPLPPLRKK